MLMKNYSILVALNITVICLMLVSCTDQSTGAEEEISDKGKGIVNVSGAFEAQHEGFSWYAGLKIGDEGKYANYTMTVSDVPANEEREESYNFSIRFIADEGPFAITAGEYEIGNADKGVIVAGVYNNKSGSDLISYGISPDSEGTVTIESITDNSVKASFDLRLDASPNTEDGMITVKGNLSADCLAVSGLGC